MDLSNIALKMFGLGGTIAGGENLNDMGTSSDLPGLAQEYAKARAARLAQQPGSLASAAPAPAPAPAPTPAPAPAAPMWANATGANFGSSGVPMPMPRPSAAIAQARMGLPAYDPNGTLGDKAANRVYDDFKASPAGQRMASAGMVSLGGPQPQHQGLIDRIGAAFQGNPSSQGLIGRMSNAFQHNAMSMRDPSTGGFIDPSGAAQAQQQQVRGPDLINKMMTYLHQQPTGSIGNNNDPSTLGSG